MEDTKMTQLETLVKAVMDGEQDETLAAAKQVIQEGVPVEQVIEALTAGMREIGRQFACLDIFLPEMLMAAQAMKAVMQELGPELKKSAIVAEKKGCVVIGAVEGDMHEIGKNIIITLLTVQGFEVHDLGTNVNVLDFVKKAVEVNADVIGASSLMTTTMPNQKDIIEILKEKGIRDKYHVIFGGAPVTQEWVDECGADSWGENAGITVKILERVMKERRE
jgi:corrinoid protein of di/trimethylamine methyltransferase